MASAADRRRYVKVRRQGDNRDRYSTMSASDSNPAGRWKWNICCTADKVMIETDHTTVCSC
ncbi:hypothetical protein TYRP_003710 [Tyrophagus putrescentiae]|nr:hypothetical protein TYRP_003710 [Tyrophagus putrescentiae]